MQRSLNFIIILLLAFNVLKYMKFIGYYENLSKIDTRI